MRLAALALAAATLAGCQSAATPVPTLSTPPIADHVRTTLIVSDMPASLALYRDALGFTLVSEREIGTDAISAPTSGAPGARARFAVLRGPDEARGMIGLIQWTDPPMPDRMMYDARLSQGSVVLVIRVADADRVCSMASRIEGVTITMPLRETSYPNASGGAPVRSLGCTLFDPDGTLLELNQRIAN